jgi:putative nucleotidyltransferase with HDIG domain
MIRWLQRLQRRLTGPGREVWGTTRLIAADAELRRKRPWSLPLLAGLVLAALHLVLFPPVPRLGVDVLPEMGGIADEDIRAPFAFEAELLPQDVEMRRIQRVLAEPPVLRRLEVSRQQSSLSRLEVFAKALRDTRSMVDLTLEERQQLLEVQFPYVESGEIVQALTAPDVDRLLGAMTAAVEELTVDGVADILPPGQYNRVLVVDDQAETLRELTAITPQRRLMDVLPGVLRRAGLPPGDAGWVPSLTRRFITPNLIYDAEETRIKQDQARQTVSAVRGFIQGEKIVGRGDRVTEQQALYLQALRARLRNQRATVSGSSQLLLAFASRLAMVLLVLGIFGWIGRVYFPRVLEHWRSLVAMVVFLALGLCAAAFALSRPGLGPFAVPVALVALLTTVIYKDKAGFASSVLLVSLLAILPGSSALDLTALLLLALATVVAVRRIQKRSQFYQIIGFLTLFSLVLLVVVRTAGGESLGDVGSEFLVALMTPAISVAFALFLLPLVEPLVGICSDLTLLELSDLNHPLLKRMALESPGTYHHSQVVGQLAEQAARAIGTNALQVRVGALFHDIGKMLKSEYYVENQRPGQGGNKHDELSPSMSALIIASHVREGIELARRWRLPQEVIDFIPEHHGTQVMEYFYHKALEGEGNETVKVDDFRYPGPKPRRRETAVLMLADAVEAATRSLAKPTPSRIKEITKQICDKRMLSGELDDSNLTLSDVARIREAFIPLLTGIHHARIAYPGQRDREKEREKDRDKERDKERDKDRDKDREKGRDKERDKDRDKDRERPADRREPRSADA